MKDQLLGCYLKPYVAKILYTHKQLVYIDCFAGKGNQVIDEDEIHNDVVDHFSQCCSWTSLNEALAVFFVKYGAICKSGEIRKILKKPEDDKRLEVIRSPGLTENGRPSTFMTEGHGKSVTVKWVK